MRIDAYTHFMPSRMFKVLVDSGYPDIGKRMREVPCIHDLEIRKKVVDTFKDYAQIISYAMPPLEVFAKGDAVKVEEYARMINDEQAEICAKHPDHFPGWVAQGALGAVDAGVSEAKRAIGMGALGVQIYTNVAGKPLDDPKFEPFFAAMESSTSRSGCIRRAIPDSPTMPAKQNRNTKSGGPSVGRTRRRRRWRGWCSRA